MERPSFIHRQTFFAVLVADTLLVCFASYLSAHGVTSFCIAIPLWILNLPAIPLALFYSIRGGGGGADSIGICVAMFTSEIILSSLAWGAYAASQAKRRRQFSN